MSREILLFFPLLLFRVPPHERDLFPHGTAAHGSGSDRQTGAPAFSGDGQGSNTIEYETAPQYFFIKSKYESDWRAGNSPVRPRHVLPLIDQHKKLNRHLIKGFQALTRQS